jgi:hypothetical protein
MAEEAANAEIVRSNARLQVLADVSHAFAMVATDYQTLLQKIARTMAELVGDGCLVTLVHADGETLVNVANAHRDPTLEAIYRPDDLLRSRQRSRLRPGVRRQAVRRVSASAYV